jgi:serine/threonine-protein kinase
MDPQTLQPGYRLDRYELLCPLAYGGMASVWLARFGGRLGFERLVVVKMILPQYSQDPRFQEMFLDEARIASRIEHTNVARILDVGEHDENHFIVMEWVDGDSLSKVMRANEQRKQRVPAGVALRVVADAAAGLHAAHSLKDRDGTSLGVVHRDVSPQNILISNNGATMLIDFGVAKARDRVSQDTSAGQLKGKIRYMAPEQALGQGIDHRADVWALGAILYELFAGAPPFDGPNEVATLHKLTSGATPPPLPAGTPREIDVAVGRALSHDPERRYATALEMNLALEAAMIEIGEPASRAVVAQYTAHLLADRKAARKRAVDAALASARAREGGEGSIPPRATGAHRVAFPTPAPSSRQSVTPPIPSGSELPSAPSQASRPPPTPPPPPVSDSQGPMGLGEVPSTTSTATLGSAAIEYPPVQAFDPDLARRRRLVGVALGVSVAAGVVGVVLIISAAMRRHSVDVSAASGELPGVTAASVEPGSTAPPVATAGATAGATPGATAETGDTAAGGGAGDPGAAAAPPASAAIELPATDPAPAASATGSAATSGSGSAADAPAPTRAPSHPTSAPAHTPRWTPPARTTPKPAAPSIPTGVGKYGF